ncbi:50S ribosomal protein L7/L12 [SAR202 cluster bacterium AD-804-J14_MRT_500m]|nr:50S ribosomal protein L7/L12 [SAR202 cluster bacterium AD-804-J14_MRT_500m]
MNKEEILQAIKDMSVLELSELVKELEDQFGVSAAPVAVAAAVPVGGAASAADAPQVEEQTEFTVVLQDIGPNKINVIKAVRELTSLGLREAKEMVESAPKPIKESVSKDEATEIEKKLVEVGATVAVQ